MGESKKPEETKIWEPEAKDYDDFLTEEKAKFVFDNAVLFHEGQIETTAILRAKALSISSFVLSLTLLAITIWLAIAEIVDLWVTHPKLLLSINLAIALLPIHCFVAVLFSIPVLLDMLKPKKLWCSGDEPQALIKKEKLCKSLAEIYIDRCFEYQKRINQNQKINEKSSKIIRQFFCNLKGTAISLAITLSIAISLILLCS